MRRRAEIIIEARDGYPLRASVLTPNKDRHRLLVVFSAIATPRGFYENFAAWFAEAGYSVLTFDYRGTGESRPPTLRGFAASMSDWATLDMAGVLDWAHERYPDHHMFVIAHSVGGQLAGLLDNAGLIEAMVTVSSPAADWRLQRGAQKIVFAALGYVLFPVLPRVLGYLPWSRVAHAGDVPAGVAQQWGRWIRLHGYVLGDDRLPLHRYREFHAPVLAYSISDDALAPARAVDVMMAAYPSVERRSVVPTDYGLTRLGHVGFFRPRAVALWVETAEWLREH